MMIIEKSSVCLGSYNDCAKRKVIYIFYFVGEGILFLQQFAFKYSIPYYIKEASLLRLASWPLCML